MIYSVTVVSAFCQGATIYIDPKIDLIHNDSVVKSTSEPGEKWKEVNKDSIPTETFTLPPGVFYVSDHARFVSVRTFKRGTKVTILKTSIDDFGYHKITLYNKFTGNAFIARVVKMTFDGPPDNLKMQCDHKNRLIDDNHLSNLEWVTPSENRINQRPRTINQDREKYPEPDGWELHTYHDHHAFANIAACAETGFIVVKQKNGGIRPIKYHRDGNYWRVSAGTTRKRKKIAAHRMVWECVTGDTLKSDNVIDHIISNRENNQMSNLRRSNSRDNARNRKIAKNNTSGITGVYYHEDRDKYVVRITDNEGKRIYEQFEYFKDAVLRRQYLEEKFGGYKIVSS